MTDAEFAKCADGDCPWRISCLRFTREDAGPEQTYAIFNRKPGALKCADFVSIWEEGR